MKKMRLFLSFLLVSGCLAAFAGQARAQETEAGGVPIREVVTGMASRMIRMNPSPEVVRVMRDLIVRISVMDPEQLGAGIRQTTTTDQHRTDQHRTDPYRTDPYRTTTTDPYRSDPYHDDGRSGTGMTGGRAAPVEHRRMSGADMGPLYTIYLMMLEYHKNYGNRETRQVFLEIIRELTAQLEVEEREPEEGNDGGVEDGFF